MRFENKIALITGAAGAVLQEHGVPFKQYTWGEIVWWSDKLEDGK